MRLLRRPARRRCICACPRRLFESLLLRYRRALRELLIAHNRTVEEMAEIIGVDSLGFISIENTKRSPAARGCHGFCTACFDNEYPTEEPAATDFSKYDRKISEAK